MPLQSYDRCQGLVGEASRLRKIAAHGSATSHSNDGAEQDVPRPDPCDVEPGRGDPIDQLRPGVPPNMADSDIVAGPQPHVTRHGDPHRPTGTQDTPELTQGGGVVVDVLEDVEADDEVGAPVAERESSGVRADRWEAPVEGRHATLELQVHGDREAAGVPEHTGVPAAGRSHIQRDQAAGVAKGFCEEPSNDVPALRIPPMSFFERHELSDLGTLHEETVCQRGGFRC